MSHFKEKNNINQQPMLISTVVGNPLCIIKKMWRPYHCDSNSIFELYSPWFKGGLSRKSPEIRHFTNATFPSLSTYKSVSEADAHKLNTAGYNIYTHLNHRKGISSCKGAK